MVSPTAGQRAHSARVEIELILDPAGQRTVVPVAQVGAGFLVTSESVECSPTDAELVLRVDGSERRRAVRLPDGLGTESREARILSAG
jgi:hypothetical protein